jgi:hypothetical protein
VSLEIGARDAGGSGSPCTSAGWQAYRTGGVAGFENPAPCLPGRVAGGSGDSGSVSAFRDALLAEAEAPDVEPGTGSRPGRNSLPE